MFLINPFTANKTSKDGLTTVYVDDLSPDEEWGPIDPSLNGQPHNIYNQNNIFYDIRDNENTSTSYGIFSAYAYLNKLFSNVKYDAKYIASTTCKKSLNVVESIITRSKSKSLPCFTKRQ